MKKRKTVSIAVLFVSLLLFVSYPVFASAEESGPDKADSRISVISEEDNMDRSADTPEGGESSEEDQEMVPDSLDGEKDSKEPAGKGTEKDTETQEVENILEAEMPGIYQKIPNAYLRSAATSNLQVGWRESLGFIDPELLSLNDPYNVSIKYVDSSDGKNPDMKGKWRMVYCIQYQKNAPEGEMNWDGGGRVSPSIAYLLYWGCRYWEQESVWSGYRTGYGWKYDCLATQYAVHITNGEFSLSTLYSHLKGPKKEHFYSIVKKMVEDSKYPPYYEPFASGWKNLSYSLSDSSVAWKAESYKGQEGFTTKWIEQRLSDGQTECSQYITSRNVTADHGAAVIWKDSGDASAFRLWIPKETYLKMQVTGDAVIAKVTGTHSSYLSGWVYKSTNPDKYQMVTLLEGGGGNTTHEKSVTAPVPEKNIDCYIDLQKTDKDSGETSPRGEASFFNAIYEIRNSDGLLVATLNTDEQGRASSASLALGDYTVREITPSKGYGLDKNEYKVSFANTDISQTEYRIEIRSEEPVQTGSVHLKKVIAGTDTPLEHVKFYLYDESGTKVGEYETDEKGSIFADNLLWGKYSFVEQQTVEGFELSQKPVEFEINEESSRGAVELQAENKMKPVTIVLEKEIRADEINFANGVPVFLFQVEGVDVCGKKHVWNKTVSFSKEYVEQNKTEQGTVRNQAVFKNLPAGIYQAGEAEVMRYSLEKITEIENGAKKGGRAEFTLLEKDFGKAVFINRKDEWGDWSDTALCENMIGKTEGEN